jgi:hypothetical protein
MEESSQLIEVALTVAIALAVGFTGAAFGQDSPATQLSCRASQTQILIDRVIRALAPGEQEVSSSPRENVEI